MLIMIILSKLPTIMKQILQYKLLNPNLKIPLL